MIKVSKDNKDKIISYFKSNKILIMLTDTVYGIMAIANGDNELRINKIKHSDINKKLSVIFPNKDYLYKYLDIDSNKRKLIEEKLPGKYTFIVNLNNFSDFKRNDFGIRITGNDYLQDILSEVGPVLATSCNISGNSICNSIDSIEKVFKDEDIILVIDDVASGIASTIIDIRDDIKVIRK